MKVISVFNNKGGVGKTTLTFHLAHQLADLGYSVLLMDADPQCNLSIYCIEESSIGEIWDSEDDYIDDFARARENTSDQDWETLVSEPRSLHFYLKPTEDGTADIGRPPTPRRLKENLDIIIGRLTLHSFEDTVSSRWSGFISGEPLPLRTLTRLRLLAEEAANYYGYDYVITDTSPSVGRLNRLIIATADGFLIPCTPDLFSLYGIKNIGNALRSWQEHFYKVRQVNSQEKLRGFPDNTPTCLGYVIMNAKKYRGKNKWNLSNAAYHYAEQIPHQIHAYIPEEVRLNIGSDEFAEPIGGQSVMHSHAGMPSTAQRFHVPMWDVPNAVSKSAEDYGTIVSRRKAYESTQQRYRDFAFSLLDRLGNVR